MTLQDLIGVRRRLRRRARRGESRQVVLHVGVHKTGTSLVQALLKAESDRLRPYGFSYERAFYRLGKTLVHGSPVPAAERQSLRQEFRALLDRHSGPVVLGSSESLFGDPFTGYANIRAVAEDLRAILDGERVRIVACIRRQDEFVQSLYHQHVKLGGTLTFDRFVETHDVSAYEWDRLLAEYAGAFGRENLSVCCYDVVFGTGADVLAGIFPDVGRAGFRTRSRPALVNPALSRKGIAMAIRCNDLLTPEEQKTFRRFLEQEFPRPPGEPHGLFSPEQRQKLLDSYAESNVRCFQQFVGATPHPAAHWLGETHTRRGASGA